MKNHFVKNAQLIFFLCCSVVIISCKKECRFKNLPKKDCGDNFHEIEGTYSKEGFAKLYPHNEIFIINSDSLYKSIYSNDIDSMPFGPIDFTTKTLIGVVVHTNNGHELKVQGYLCKKNNVDDYKFTIEYSLSDQCEDGTNTYTFTATFISSTKIDSNANVSANIVNVNPTY